MARAHIDVSLVARGAHLAAMRARGLRLQIDGEEHVAHPPCTDVPSELGVQDYVIIALKAHAIADAVDAIIPLLGPHTCIVTASNGLPYWYFDGVENLPRGTTLESIDPEGRQSRTLGPGRAVGCVVFPAADVIAPGGIRHEHGRKLPIGGPGGERSVDGVGALGAHKMSMLQDLERGRPMEIEPLVGVVQELGRLLDMPTPTIDTVLAILRQRARSHFRS